MNKKKWGKPELIILTRSRSEEAVLDNCKGNGGNVGPASANQDCAAIDCVSNCDRVALS
jgi:hypothetical protein